VSSLNALHLLRTTVRTMGEEEGEIVVN